MTVVFTPFFIIMPSIYTAETTLPRALAKVTRSDIRAAVGSTIYQRGEQYYGSGAVEDISYTDSHTLDATVSGSEFYEVQIYLDGDTIEAECDCPYDGGTCKHVVAVLLEAMNEGDSIRGYMDDGNDDEEDEITTQTSGVMPLKAVSKASTTADSAEFRQYVESLSVKELQNLVLQYAPADFRRTVLTRSLNMSDAEKVINAAERSINKIFDTEFLRHNNHELEKQLLRECERVRGLWEMFPERIGTMLCTIMRTIDEGFEEGDFYEDYHDEGFSSRAFDDYVVQFIRAIPSAKKAAIIEDIRNVLAEAGFGAFMDIEKRKAEWYTSAEIPVIKDAILKAIRLNKYDGNAELDYKTISPDLDDDERETMLLATHSTSNELTLELATFYENIKRPADALDAVDKRLAKLSKEGYFFNASAALVKKRCELAAFLKELPSTYLRHAKNMLTITCNADVIQSACKYLKTSGEAALLLELETLAEKKSPQEFFRYLEMEQRFQECWEQVAQKGKIYEEIVYAFAVKRLKHEPEEAKKVLLQRLQTRIPVADDSAYSDVAEALKYLSEIDDKHAREILEDLRTNYKRRTNLMRRLDAAFGRR
jgi:hypothetical protein